MKSNLRCLEGRLWRHAPQWDDPYLETEIGECPECRGKGCDDGVSREFIVEVTNVELVEVKNV